MRFRRSVLLVATCSLALAAAPAHAQGGDTTRVRAVEISDGYYTRLRVHRYAAYTILPLFAYQAIVGQQLWNGLESERGPADWVRPAHRAGAVAIGTAFAINTVTGAMNLWESRAQTEGRTRRLLHGLSMTTALAGFTYAGVRLSEEAHRSAAKREQHRNVALGSMALTLVSGTAMWLTNR